LKRIGSKHNRQREQAIPPIEEQQTNIMDSGTPIILNRKKSTSNRQVKIVSRKNKYFILFDMHSVLQRWPISMIFHYP
jgi:hypothetical protein